ncbi:hypothetical protein MTO96_051904, partial [Rhipicephalus appendiculatus]
MYSSVTGIRCASLVPPLRCGKPTPEQCAQQAKTGKPGEFRAQLDVNGGFVEKIRRGIQSGEKGWDDVSFHGSSQIPTSNLDALAADGVILNALYAMPACTPSRSALMSGRYPIRIGTQGAPLMVGEPWGLPQDVPILPEYLKELGYETHLVGK